MTDEQRRTLAWGLAAVAGGIVLWQLWPRVANAHPVSAPSSKRSRPPVQPSKSAPPTPKAAAQVSLNRAASEALETLSGIGPELAERIIEARPFEEVDDLLEVLGIGPATLEGLRADVEI